MLIASPHAANLSILFLAAFMKKLRGGHIVITATSSTKKSKPSVVAFQRVLRPGRKPTYIKKTAPPSPDPSTTQPRASVPLVVVEPDDPKEQQSEEHQLPGDVVWEDEDAKLPRRTKVSESIFLPSSINGCLSHLQTAHDHLREWKETHRNVYMPVYLEHAGRRNIQCQGCQGSEPANLRCIDCFGSHCFCQACILEIHQKLPCHRLEKWNGDCFIGTTLMSEGFLLHLGHGGLACPNMDIDKSGEEDDSACWGKSGYSHTLTLVGVAGFFLHKVAWCRCLFEGGRVTSAMQLFQERLFPATHTRPETAFSFDVLDHFWVDMMECKTSNQAFVRKLGRITNPDFPDDSPVCSCFLPFHMPLTSIQQLYHQLMYCSRSYRDMVTRANFGYGHETPQDPAIGGLALFCPACPQPGYNLPDNWRDDPAQ